MKRKFELLRQAVNTYKENHVSGRTNEKELLDFIDELEALSQDDVIMSAGYKTFHFLLDNRKADQLRATLNEYKSLEYTTIVQFKRNGGQTHIGIQYHEMFIIELVWLGIHTGIALKTLKAQ